MGEKIPKGWKRCKIKEIGIVVTGTTPSKNNPEFWGNEILFITPSDYKNYNKWCYYSERRLSSKGKDNLIKKLLPPKSILVTCIGSDMGKIVINPFPVITNQQINSIVINNKKAHYGFIYYLLLSMSEELKMLGHSGGSALPILNKSTFENIEIVIPESLDEQKAIASVLSSLDDKIDLLHLQNETLEQMAETLFRKWFIEDAKEDWEEVKLGDIAEIKIGRTPPRKEFHWFSKNKNENNTKWVSVKDLGENGVFIFNTAEYLTNEAIEKFKIPIIPANTVLLSFKMTIGRMGITTEKMVSNEAIAHFILKQDTLISNEYLYLFLKTFKFQELGSTSTIVTSINSKMIKDINITIPEKNLMLKFYKITRIIFTKIKYNQQQILTLEQLRDTLLPKLMSGEVRVKYNKMEKTYEDK